MKILIDLNVLLDVLQKREPHYHTASRVLNEALQGRVTGLIAGHAITTLHYVIVKFGDKTQADGAVDWLLDRFQVAGCDGNIFRRARALTFRDFEDAVVAALAEREGCERIVSRNLADFASSPVPAISPEEFLKR